MVPRTGAALAPAGTEGGGGAALLVAECGAAGARGRGADELAVGAGDGASATAVTVDVAGTTNVGVLFCSEEGDGTALSSS